MDAGLQYNYEDDPSLPNLDNYEPFIGIRNEPKLVYTSTDPPGDLKPHYINCGSGPASMEFRVAPWELNLSRTGSGCVAAKGVGSANVLKACGRFAFILERGVGGVGQRYNEEVIVWVAPSISFGGWGVFATSPQGTAQKPQTYYWPQVPCGGCIFKWVTGIGQEQENLTDGSLYSATWRKRGIAPWATNPGTLVLPPFGNSVPMTANLTLYTEYPLWRGIYDGTTAKEDCSDTPAVTGNAGDVKVRTTPWKENWTASPSPRRVFRPPRLWQSIRTSNSRGAIRRGGGMVCICSSKCCNTYHAAGLFRPEHWQHSQAAAGVVEGGRRKLVKSVESLIILLHHPLPG